MDNYTIYIDGEFANYYDSNENLSACIPVRNLMGLCKIKDTEAISDKEVFRQAVSMPSSGKTLTDIAESKNVHSVCIIISDVTRGVPTKIIAPYIVEELEAAGVPKDGIFFLVALGVHRPATENEMREFIGDDLFESYRILNHDAFSPEALKDIGTTSRGTRVIVNKAAYEADMRIVVGKVELHEFAGFSGGRKSILPGISAEETIVRNHHPHWLENENAKAGILDSNPIHLDMLEAANILGIDFCVNFIVNNANEPVAIYCGELDESHRQAANYLKNICNISLSSKPDIIVTTCGSALSTELYQAMKPIISLTDIIDENTTVILYAPCPEGVNSPDMMYPFRKYNTYDEIDDYVKANFKIQMDHTLPWTRILRTGCRLIAYTPGVAKDELELLHFEHADSLQEAINMSLKRFENENPKVLFFPMAQRALTVIDYDHKEME